jgi:hypothetical protein
MRRAAFMWKWERARPDNRGCLGARFPLDPQQARTRLANSRVIVNGVIERKPASNA